VFDPAPQSTLRSPNPPTSEDVKSKHESSEFKNSYCSNTEMPTADADNIIGQLSEILPFYVQTTM